MELEFKELPFYKRWLYNILGFSIIPIIISPVGLIYISVPEEQKTAIKSWIPNNIKDYSLSLYSAETWLVILLVITIICSIWGGIGSHINAIIMKNKYKVIRKSYISLKKESESKSINCYHLFSNWLYSYSNHLNLTVSERVSLYKLDMNLFSCIGRYSENEKFNSKPSRLYPRHQGGISRTWEAGVFEDTGAPDPENDMQAWVDYNVDNYDFTEEDLSKIRMKSRAFYGIRLKNLRQQTIAVILFESLQPNGLPIEKCKRLLNSQEKMNLISLIDSLDKHIPTLESARKEGF
ncbi:hypothetical protein M3I01_000830 [Marinomonas sp. RSW2]|uniref:Uncharacterized protein n=1 Tax=Marinomonas maritima TaxID=2940935 RepID=A0ABT5WCY0_9GAMM|nr:hypothetical protein [Marinomonas maritima]MDE8601471.1 hypothetical protein [Marinomonas maritima]